MRGQSPHPLVSLVDVFHFRTDDSSDGRVVRASASGAVDLGSIPSRAKPLTLKLVITASLLDAQH